LKVMGPRTRRRRRRRRRRRKRRRWETPHFHQ
jgi:hypothetical protein